MKLTEYKEHARRTAPDLGEEMNELHMRMGVSTEFGELIDIFKRHVIYGKELDMVHVSEEIGDIMWYLVNQLNFNDVDITPLDAILTSAKIPFPTLGEALKEMVDILGLYATYKHPSIIICSLIGFSNYFELNFEEILDKNIEKLKVRFPEKFEQELALNRDLDKERKTLE